MFSFDKSNRSLIKAVFHESHPEKETDRVAVKSVREFLVNANVKPEDY